MNSILDEYNEILSAYSNLIDLVDSLNDISEEVERIKPLHSLELSKKAYEIAFKEDYKDGICRSIFRMGRSQWLLGNLDQSVTLLMESLDISKDFNIANYEVDILRTLGNVNINLQIYDRALNYYMKGLKILKNSPNPFIEAAILNNIGEIYRELNDYDTALEYYTKSKNIYNSLEGEYLISIPILNMASIYYSLEEYDLAMENNEISLSICKNSKDKIVESYTLHQLGKVYFKLGEKEKAKDFLDESLKISEELGDKFHEIDILIDVHNLFLSENLSEKALKSLNRALELAEEINTKSVMAKVYSHLATTYEKMKNCEKTLYYYKKYHNTEVQSNNNNLEQKLRSITLQLTIEQSLQEKEIYHLTNITLKQKTEELENKTKELSESYKNIQIISDIGQSITSTLNLKKILIRVYESINTLIDATSFGIGLYDDKTNEVHFKLYIEDSTEIPEFSIPLTSKSSWATWCLLNRKEIMINDVENQYSLYLKERKNTIGKKMESLIYCPLIVEDKVLGVMTVQSINKNAYNKYNFDMVKALASYIAIAINNANESEKLQEEIKIREKAQRELEKLNKELVILSEIDGLTGVPNRRRFDECFNIEWNKSEVYSDPISLLLIDIDYFKEYNDHYGHLAGDEVIKTIAEALNNVVKRSTDFFARYGGDEFVTVLPNTNSKGALTVAKEMKEAVAKLNIPHEFSPLINRITITIGVSSMIPSSNLTKENLINDSDMALYYAKKQGRDRIEFLSK